MQRGNRRRCAAQVFLITCNFVTINLGFIRITTIPCNAFDGRVLQHIFSYSDFTDVVRYEYAGAAERKLSAALECAYQVLADLLPNGGGCDIIDGIILGYAREFESKLRAKLSGHTGLVRALTALPRSRLASGSADWTVRVWSTVSGACEVTLEGHTDTVNALVALPNDQLASSSGDHTVRIWETTTGSCLCIMLGHTDDVVALAALPNNLLASGSDDNSVRLWNIVTGDCLHTLHAHISAVTALAMLPDGHLLSVSYDRTMCVWNHATGDCMRQLEIDMLCTSLAVLSDRRVAIGSNDGWVYIWDILHGKYFCEPHVVPSDCWAAGERTVHALAVLSDGLLVSLCSNTRVWDLATGGCTHELKLDSVALASLPSGGFATGIGFNRFIDKSNDFSVLIYE